MVRNPTYSRGEKVFWKQSLRFLLASAQILYPGFLFTRADELTNPSPDIWAKDKRGLKELCNKGSDWSFFLRNFQKIENNSSNLCCCCCF